MIDKSRFKRGTELPQSKLTEGDVRLVRQLHEFKQREIKRLNEALSIEALARKFDVHRGTIEKALSYACWRHVSG